jgi:hypothetical protein
MSDAKTGNARITRFFEDFLRPLVCGGTAVASAPLTTADVEHMTLADYAPSEVLLAISRAITDNAAARGVEAEPRRLSKSVLTTAAAYANLALHSDPFLSTSRFEVRRQRLLDTTTSLLDVCAPLEERIDAIVAHVLTTRFAEVERVETDYRFWLGAKRFVGRRVPPSLMRLAKLRRVRTQESRARLLDVLPLDARPLWLKLVDRSPITLLASPALAPSVIVTEDTHRVLGDPILSRYVRAELERLPTQVRDARVRAIGAAALNFTAPHGKRLAAFAEDSRFFFQGTP